jgi:hypothetical protein
MLERAFGDNLIVPCPSGPQPERPQDKAAMRAPAAEILVHFALKTNTRRTPVTSHMDDDRKEAPPIA